MSKISERIDMELEEITISDQMKQNIYRGKGSKKTHRMLRYVAGLAVVLLLGTTTVAAFEYLNRTYVNGDELPELDKMEIIQMNELQGKMDEFGCVIQEFSDYDALQQTLGVDLLDTELSTAHDFMVGKVDTNNKDYAMITVENFIIGDTTNYRSAEGEPTYMFEYQGKPYTYDRGQEYFTTVSLGVDIILSEEQHVSGFEKEYLGAYEFVESYISEQGYKVNLVKDTMADDAVDLPDNFQSEKVAVFVADGIQYELKGNVSIEIMKEIVDSME